MDKKYCLFAFNGELMCFAHALLNALDLHSNGYEVKFVLEGSATKLIADFEKEETPFRKLYLECIEKGLLDCVCRACSKQMGTLELAQKNGLPLCEDMSGHPSMERYIKNGYQIITF
jgi:predicted peroxiredoxin